MAEHRIEALGGHLDQWAEQVANAGTADCDGRNCGGGEGLELGGDTHLLRDVAAVDLAQAR